MKLCQRCLKKKALDNFYKDPRMADGRRSYCKPCSVALVQESINRNPERRRVYDRAYYRRNKGRWVRTKEEMRADVLKKYGLTATQYEELLKSQEGVCAICKEPDPFKENLSVDHDHSCCAGRKSCGECIRGLLCSRCNRMIGLAREKPETLIAAVDYLTLTHIIKT